MNQVAELIRPEAQTASTSIALVVAQTPAVVLLDAGKRDDLYAHIRQEVDAFTPDLSTTKGRDAIKALAFKITRTKTAIDAAGKKLNEDARAKINVVDTARRDAREQLERMADEVRQPLTEWEAAEDRRKEVAAAQLASLAEAGRVSIAATAASVMAAIAALESEVIDAEVHREAEDIAHRAKASSLQLLNDAHARLLREEADRAELERLRAEAAERDRQAAENAAAEEAQRQRVEEERRAQERRAAAEKAEAERIARAEREAANRAQRDAEARAKAERDAAERAHAEALAAERRRADEAEAARQAEAQRIERKEQVRQAEARRVAEEQARREKDRAHRGTIMGEAKAAIMTCGVDEPIAKGIVLAIVAGNVPHTAIRF